jgi:hypothetical protein
MWLKVKYCIIFSFSLSFCSTIFSIQIKRLILRESLLVHSEEMGRKWGNSAVLGFYAAGIGSSYVTDVSREPVGLFING